MKWTGFSKQFLNSSFQNSFLTNLCVFLEGGNIELMEDISSDIYSTYFWLIDIIVALQVLLWLQD